MEGLASLQEAAKSAAVDQQASDAQMRRLEQQEAASENMAAQVRQAGPRLCRNVSVG